MYVHCALSVVVHNRCGFLTRIVQCKKTNSAETEITKSQRSRASSPSIRNPASKEITSDSVELCETEICFPHIQLSGTKVRLPKIHKTPHAFDFESSRTPAKSESWNRPNLQVLRRVLQMTILSEIVCEMNKENQPC